ncbi:MAG: UvrD-helicase domain-containing protein [Candidatus Cloacimonetes bacterium]|nr:UvrD-helicase domain-containing protein [Candidatus Cloacimonadota bacterium]
MKIDKNYFVTAGAGAGKTTLLSKHFCKILDISTKNGLGVKIENILVITFTKKAAAEMQKRIYDTIDPSNKNHQYQFENISQKEREKCLENFSNNNISTIDAFCSKIIRKHPLLTQIDPNYEVLSESETTQIRNEIVDNFLKKVSNLNNDDVNEILRFWDKDKIKKFLIFSLENYQKLQKYFVEIKEKNPEEILQDSIKNNSPKKISDFINFLKRKKTFFEKFTSLNIDFPIQNIFENIINILDKFSETDSKFQRQKLLKKIIENIGNTKYYSFTNYRQLGKKIIWENAGLTHLYKEIKDENLGKQFEEIFPFESTKFLHSETDKQAAILTFHLQNIFQTICQNLENWKQNNQKFEYQDVLQKTIKLLGENEKIRKEFAAHFKYIFVDEFQDTNYPQWELIKLLAKEKSGEISRKKIFLVYDEKQSIYRFRGSDITVIQKAKEDTKIPNPQIKAMNSNYRSNENLVKCFNFMFKKMFPKKKQFDFEAEFQKAKSTSKMQFDGFVDIAFQKKNESFTDYENSCLEAQLVGKKIEEYKKFKPEIYDEKAKKPCFAILVDSRRKFVTYQHILRLNGIDCSVVGGTGFFQTQEIYDVYNLLTFLVNQNDEIALIGLLRSPLFSFSDNDIYTISKLEGKTFFEKLGKFNSKTISELDDLKNLSYQLSLNEFLEYIAKEKFLYFSLLANSKSGRQKLANFEKLITISAKFSSNGKGLHDFQQYLKTETEFNQHEEFAKIPIESEVIIMTIHQAKGLQFPVVIIPDITHKSKSSVVEPFLIERIKNEIKLGVSLYDNFNNGRRTVSLNRIKSQIKNEEAAEQKRLFYVACTRAQSILCFVCQTDEKISQKNILASFKRTTWDKYLMHFFDFENISFPESIAESPLKISSQEVHKNKLPVRIQTYLLERKKIQSSDFQTSKKNYFPPENDFLKFPKIFRFSVTDMIQSFEILPSKLDKTEKISYSKSAKFGTALHYFLESKIFEINKKNEKKIKNYLLHNLEIENPESYISEIKSHLKNCKNSEIYDILKEKISYKIFPEFAVNYLSKNQDKVLWQIFAKIDLLYQDDENNWHLIDYKTNKGASLEKIIDSHNYDLQLQLYAYIFKKRFGISISSARIYSTYFNQFHRVKKIRNDILEDKIEEFIWNSKKAEYEVRNEKNKTIKTDGKHSKYLPFDELNFAKKIVVITSNKSISKEINNSLQTPFIKAYSLQNYLIQLCEFEIKNTIEQQTQYLILKQIIEKELKFDISHFPNLIDKSQQAINLFYQDCKKSANTTKFFKKLYDSYKNYLEKNNLSDFDDIYTFLLGHPELITKVNFIILDDFYYNSFPLSKRILDFLKQHSNSFSAISSHKISVAEIACFGCMNLQNEVKNVAKKILTLLNNGTKIDEIKIILSDYEKYFPIIENLFPQYGIKYQIAKGKKLKVGPIYPLFNAIFRMLFHPYKFENIYHFFSNYLVTSQLKIDKFDLIARNKNISNFEYILKNLHSSNLDDNEKKTLKYLKKVITNFFIVPISQKIEPNFILEKINNILEKFSIFENIENLSESSNFAKDNLKSFEQIRQILETLSADYLKLKIKKVSLQKYFDDFTNYCEFSEYKKCNEYFGVKILGLWESISHKARYGFVLGMAEEIFPGNIKTNFLVPKIDIFKRKLKNKVFSQWRQNFEQLFLLYPKEDEDGNPYQKSTFLKNISQKEFQDDNKSFSQKEYFQNLMQKNKKIFFKNPEFLKTISERMQNLSPKSFSKFEGRIDKFKKEKNHYSVSEINLLAKCPMKYFFKKIVSLSELPKFEEEYEKKYIGVLIHQILEDFGRNNGFEKPLIESFPLIDKIAKKKINESNFDMKNMFVKKEFEKYVSGLGDKNRVGIFKNFLEVDNKIRIEKNWKPIKFEYDFGAERNNFLIIQNDEKKIYIGGRIDRIDKSDDGKYLVYDYKTGKNNFPLVKKKLEFQLPIYFLKCKNLFHNLGMICGFWNLREGVPSTYLGNLDDKINKKCVTQFVDGIAKKNEISLAEIIDEIKKIDEKVSAGKFHYSLIERKDAHCNSCEYKTICRYNEERVGMLKNIFQ